MNSKYNQLIMLGLAILISLLIGIMIPFFPWWFTPILLLSVFVILFSISKPTIAIIATFLIIFEVVPGARVMKFNSITFYDFLIIYLFFVVILKAILNKYPVFEKLKYYAFSLFYLYTFVFISTAIVLLGNLNTAVLSEGRAFIAYLILPIMLLAINNEKEYFFLTKSIVLIGVVIAFYMIIQSFFDIKIMSAARMEILDYRNNTDVTRSIAGGGTYIMIFNLYYFIDRLSEKYINFLTSTFFIIIQIGGILVSYGRGVWVASFAGLLIYSFLNGGVKKIVSNSVIFLTVLFTVLSVTYLVKPRIVEAAIDRFINIENEVKSGGSYEWRKFENRSAIDKIVQKPLTGVGIGGDYKNHADKGGFGIDTRYIHNSYLYFPLKMGVFAFFIPIFFIVAFIFVAYRIKRRSLNNKIMPILSASFSVVILTSFTQPEWANPQGIAAICIFLGLLCLENYFVDIKKLKINQRS